MKKGIIELLNEKGALSINGGRIEAVVELYSAINTSGPEHRIAYKGCCYLNGEKKTEQASLDMWR